MFDTFRLSLQGFFSLILSKQNDKGSAKVKIQVINQDEITVTSVSQNLQFKNYLIQK